MNYSEILGVDDHASPREIEFAFRRAALQTHPDHNPSQESADQFAQLMEAREKLKEKAVTIPAHEDGRVTELVTIAMTYAESCAKNSADPHLTNTSPEALKHIQALDRIVASPPRRTLLRRSLESSEVAAHRRKIERGYVQISNILG